MVKGHALRRLNVCIQLVQVVVVCRQDTYKAHHQGLDLVKLGSTVTINHISIQPPTSYQLLCASQCAKTLYMHVILFIIPPTIELLKGVPFLLSPLPGIFLNINGYVCPALSQQVVLQLNTWANFCQVLLSSRHTRS